MGEYLRKRACRVACARTGIDSFPPARPRFPHKQRHLVNLYVVTDCAVIDRQQSAEGFVLPCTCTHTTHKDKRHQVNRLACTLAITAAEVSTWLLWDFEEEEAEEVGTQGGAPLASPTILSKAAHQAAEQQQLSREQQEETSEGCTALKYVISYCVPCAADGV